MAWVSFADVFSSGPSSMADRPKSSWASWAFLLASFTFCSAVMVFENSCSLDIFAASFWLMPSVLKASEPSAALLTSVFMPMLMESIDVPLCCITASHSW